MKDRIWKREVCTAASRRNNLFRGIVSGERRGFGWALVRLLLFLLSFPYWLATKFRNAALKTGLYRVFRAEAPVVSVGNITAGGTGKTPMVEYLARFYGTLGNTPAILTRGYTPGGAKPGVASDEVLTYKENIGDIPVYVGANRSASAKRAVGDGADVLLLDDGFQHFRLARNFNIVLLDALNPFGYGRMLPRGLLREPMSALRRADAVVLTRIDLLRDDELEALRGRVANALGRYNPECPVFEAVHCPKSLAKIGKGVQGSVELADIQGKRVGAFCGLGNPDGFRRTLQSLGAEVSFFLEFPDHHDYSQDEWKSVLRLGESENCELIVTTQKDAVKLRRVTEDEILYLQVEFEITRGRDEFEGLLSEVASPGIST